MGGLSLNYLTLIAALVNLFLGSVVLQENTRGKLNRLFFIFTLALGLWAFANFSFIQFAPNVILFRATYALGGLALVLALPWVFSLAERPISRAASGAVKVLAVVVTLIPFIDGQVIESIYKSGATFAFNSGPLFNLYGGLLSVLLAYLLYFLSVSYRNANGSKRTQLACTLVGISIFAAVSFAFGVILPLFEVKTVVAFDAQSSLVWVALTTYAITRHGLFNIKVVATQSFVAVLLVLILSRIISAKSLADILFESAVLLLTAIVGFFLVGSVKNEVSRREEVERLAKERVETLKELEQRNKNLAALQKVSKMVLNQIEMKPMIQAILDEIPKQFENCTGALLNLVRGGHMAAYAISTNEFTRKVYSLVGDDLEKYSYPIKSGFNMLHDTLIDKQIKESTHLSDFISPPITKPVAATIQTLVGIKYTLGIPLFAGKEPLGVMLFSYRVPKDQLLDKDVDMAVAISDETSLAIQRAYAFQQLKDANEYLADLDQLKDEFISIASHELNTPLAAVEGYLSMILDEHMGKVDDKARLYLTRAYDSSKRLAELILDLLNVSRIEQGRIKMKFAKSNLYDLAESVMHELQVKVDAKKLTLKLEGDRKKVPLTWCDPDRIREVIVNLVGNAIKYTEKGGIRMRISEDAGRIRFEVIDTGRGISDEGKKKLFQKFSQVNRELDEQKGTGLGLYISKNFIELHKGRIWVESDEGKGSDFIFELPLLTEPPEKIDGAILEGPLSAPQVEIRDKKPPAIITASSSPKKLTS